MKIWSDGSPWIGNIETSFGYQDSPHTRAIGVHPGHRGCSNYTPEQLLELCRKYVSQGWQIACHVPGDIAVDTVLDTFDGVQQETGRTDLRLRMEHCGSITADQVRRAHELGVTISFFVAHLYYYGEVLRDFIGTHAENWTPAGAVLGPDVAIGVREAIRAQTIYPTWQLHSDHEIGSIEPGKFADFVVLDANPLTVPAHDIHTIHIRGTWINGRRVSAKTNDRAESTT